MKKSPRKGEEERNGEERINSKKGRERRTIRRYKRSRAETR